jgi:hypothetical protein
MNVGVAVYALIQIGLAWLIARSHRGILAKLAGLAFIAIILPVIIFVLAVLRRSTGVSDLVVALAVALVAVGLISVCVGWLVALAERWWVRR